MKSLHLLNKVLNISAERYLRTAGDLFVYDGDYEAALAMVEKTLEIDAAELRALVLKADILYCLNRDIEALQVLNRVLTIDPLYVEALISKSGVLDVLGRHREALTCCRKAYTLMAEQHQYLWPSLYDQMIVLLLRLRKYREARYLLNKAVGHVSEEEAGYLNSNYRTAVERSNQKRDKEEQHAPVTEKPKLTLLKN